MKEVLTLIDDLTLLMARYDFNTLMHMAQYKEKTLGGAYNVHYDTLVEYNMERGGFTAELDVYCHDASAMFTTKSLANVSLIISYNNKPLYRHSLQAEIPEDQKHELWEYTEVSVFVASPLVFASVVEDGYQETLLKVVSDTAEKLGK